MFMIIELGCSWPGSGKLLCAVNVSHADTHTSSKDFEEMECSTLNGRSLPTYQLPLRFREHLGRRGRKNVRAGGQGLGCCLLDMTGFHICGLIFVTGTHTRSTLSKSLNKWIDDLQAPTLIETLLAIGSYWEWAHHSSLREWLLVGFLYSCGNQIWLTQNGYRVNYHLLL